MFLFYKGLKNAQLLSEENKVNNFINSTTSGLLLHYFVMNLFDTVFWRLGNYKCIYSKAEACTHFIPSPLSASETVFDNFPILSDLEITTQETAGQPQGSHTECWWNFQLDSLDREDEGRISRILSLKLLSLGRHVFNSPQSIRGCSKSPSSSIVLDQEQINNEHSHRHSASLRYWSTF